MRCHASIRIIIRIVLLIQRIYDNGLVFEDEEGSDGGA
jgi:hypothetical protein